MTLVAVYSFTSSYAIDPVDNNLYQTDYRHAQPQTDLSADIAEQHCNLQELQYNIML